MAKYLSGLKDSDTQMAKYLSQRHNINNGISKPLAASQMKNYIADLENEIKWSRQTFKGLSKLAKHRSH